MIRPVNGEAGGKSSTIKSSSNCLKESPSFNDDGAMGSMFSHRIENRQWFAYASGQCNFGRFTRLGAAGRIRSCSRTFLAAHFGT
jgi:hypothetical protein